MSRLLDVLLAGGEVALRYEHDNGVVAEALLHDGNGPFARGEGRSDIDGALDSLESELSPHRDVIERQMRRLGRGQ